jgi:hypothetical protein
LPALVLLGTGKYGSGRRRLSYPLSATLTVAVFLSLTPLAGAQDGAFAACVRQLARSDLAGKTAFQEGVRDLVAARKPEFEPLADLHMALQVALARARAAWLAFLAQYHPGRIETESLAKFRNFDWSAADEAAFTAREPEIGELSAQIAELRRKNDGHRDWPGLREFMVAEL